MLFLDLFVFLRFTRIAVQVLVYADASTCIDGSRRTVLKFCVAVRVGAFELFVADDVFLFCVGGEDGLDHIQYWSFELVDRHDKLAFCIFGLGW